MALATRLAFELLGRPVPREPQSPMREPQSPVPDAEIAATSTPT